MITLHRLILVVFFVVAVAGCIPLEKMGEEGDPCSAGGACLTGFSCVDGKCVKQDSVVGDGGSDGATGGDEAMCVPKCLARQCGDNDGCGGKCFGDCPDPVNEECNASTLKCQPKGADDGGTGDVGSGDGGPGDGGCKDECTNGTMTCAAPGDGRYRECTLTGGCLLWSGPKECQSGFVCEDAVGDCTHCGAHGETCCVGNLCPGLVCIGGRCEETSDAGSGDGGSGSGCSGLASHVVVSQFATRGPTSDLDDFVEIYNPSDMIVDVGNLELRTQPSGGGAWATRAVVSSGIIMQPHTYFLFADDTGYTGGPLADKTFNTGLDNYGSIRIVDSVGNVVDAVGYGPGAQGAEGVLLVDPCTAPCNKAFFRKAYDTSTAASMSGADIDKGNGIDTNNNAEDFVLVDNRTPRNKDKNTAAPTCGLDTDGGTGDGGADAGGCGPGNCSGCCQAGQCLSGTGNPICGVGGSTCIDCGTGACVGGACQGGGCSNGATENKGCGNCGTQERICAGGAWSAWGVCTGEGACSQGANEPCDCGGQAGTRTCSGSCQWGACTNCQAADGGSGDGGGRCNASNCSAGCCDQGGTCRLGDANAACGSAGGACQECTTMPHRSCSAGACVCDSGYVGANCDPAVPEDSDATCSDGIDNDGSGKKDCAEASCDKKRCDTQHGFCYALTCNQGCLIAGSLYSTGQNDPSNDCRMCDFTRSDVDWSDLGVGLPCTTGGHAGACNGAGSCICTPSCTGKNCGDDGCGGSCGQCTTPPPLTCPDGNTRRWYDLAGNCSAFNCQYTPHDETCTYGCAGGACNPCTPVCTGKCAGAPDGCAGTCASSDCNGCCSAASCLPGTANANCGAGGGTCAACSGGTPNCVSGICQ